MQSSGFGAVECSRIGSFLQWSWQSWVLTEGSHTCPRLACEPDTTPGLRAQSASSQPLCEPIRWTDQYGGSGQQPCEMTPLTCGSPRAGALVASPLDAAMAAKAEWEVAYRRVRV